MCKIKHKTFAKDLKHVTAALMISDGNHWQEGTEKAIVPPPKFWAVEKLSDNFLLVGKFPSKDAKFGLKNPHFREI